MPLSSIGRTQKPNATAPIDQKNILDGMTLLLAAVVFLVFIVIYWSLDESFGTIMIKKAGSSVVSVLGCSIAAARRAGSVSHRCNASANTGRNSVNHLLASD